MSQNLSMTRYHFNLGLARGEASEGNAVTFTSTTGMTDALAIALVTALNGLDWQTGTSAQMYVTKYDVEQVQSELVDGQFI